MASKLVFVVLLMAIAVANSSWSSKDVIDDSSEILSDDLEGEDAAARGLYQNPFDEQWYGYGGLEDHEAASSGNEGFGSRTGGLKHVYPAVPKKAVEDFEDESR